MTGKPDIPMHKHRQRTDYSTAQKLCEAQTRSLLYRDVPVTLKELPWEEDE
jgi:hypothetical protein